MTPEPGDTRIKRTQIISFGHRAVWICLVIVFLATPLRHLDHYAWNYDEGPQLQAARLANAGYVLYEDVALNKPPLLTWYLQLAMRVLGEDLWVPRLAILLVNLLGFVAIGALGELWWGRWGGICAMVLLLLPRELTVRATVVMNDLPAVSMALISLWAASRFRVSRAPGWAAMSGLCYGAVLLIHPLLLGVLVPLLMILSYPQEGQWNRLQLSALLIGILRFVVVASGVVILALLLVDLGGFRKWVIDFNTVPLSPELVRDNIRAGALIVEYLGTHWSLVLMSCAAVYALVRERRFRSWVSVLLVWFFMVGATLYVQRPLWLHYRALLLHGLALCGGGGLSLVAHPGAVNGGRPGVGYDAGRLLNGLVLLGALATLGSEAKAEAIWPAPTEAVRATIADLRQATLPYEYVVSDDQFLAFAAGRSVPPNLTDTSYKRALTGYVTAGTVIREIVERDAISMFTDNGRLDRLPGFRSAINVITETGVCHAPFCIYEPVGIRSVDARLGSTTAIMGCKVSKNAAFPGDTVTVTLLWKCRETMAEPLSVFVHLVDARGLMIAQHDGQPMGGQLPTGSWLAGDVVPDIHPLTIPEDAFPSEYRVFAGMYHWPSMERLPVTGANGAVVRDDAIQVATVRVIGTTSGD